MMNFSYLGKLIIVYSCLSYTNLSFAGESIGNPLLIPTKLHEKYQQSNFKLLGALQLDNQSKSGEQLVEFSGLAWDNDQNLLYALSDRGYIVHLKPVFNDNILIDVELIAYYPLKDEHNQKLNGSFTDSEGLALYHSDNNKKNDTELIISFERRPRLIRYTDKGKYISALAINNQLEKIKNYAGSNKSLEAVTTHHHYNFLIAPERPLNNAINDSISIFSSNQHEWSFKPDNLDYGSLVGLTTLPDGRVIALERIFPGIFAGVTNVIHLLTFNDKTLTQTKLLELKPVDGYFNDNFEGISWHKDKRFFMISDDNDNLLQRSLLVYFEIPNLVINKNAQNTFYNYAAAHYDCMCPHRP